MNVTLRILGVVVALVGAATIATWFVSEQFGSPTPALRFWPDTIDLRRYLWIAAGCLYAACGVFLCFRRAWAGAFAIAAAVVAAGSLAYDLAAFTSDSAFAALGLARIRADIVSMLLSLMLTGLCVPLIWARVLR